MQKRLNEIKARKAELHKELDTADEKRLAEINAETTALETEERQIRAKMDLTGRLGSDPEPKPSLDEERAKDIKATGRMVIPAAEVRSILISTGGLAKPTGTGTEIKDTFNSVSSIVDQVSVMDCTGVGEWSESYVKTNPSADAGTDGTAPTPSDPVFRVAAIKPNLVNVMTYVSKNVEKLTPVAYAGKVRDLAYKALRAKVAALIANGDGSNFYGIKTAVNTSTEDIAQEYLVESATIDATTLRKIVMNYGGDENVGANARLYLNKADLIAFGDVRGTNEKKAVYEIIPDAANPNTGIIKDGGVAVPYTINSALTALSASTKGASKIKTMLYGDPANYELGLFGDYSIEVSKDYKFGEGLLTVLGEVMAGGNLIKHNGFEVVTLNTL